MTKILKDTLLLSHIAGWQKGWADATIETNGGIRLRRQPGSIRPVVDASGSFGGLTQPTGLATDRDGRIYILDSDDAQVRRFDPCTAAFDTLPCVGGDGSAPRRFKDPHGIDVSCNGDLFVADTGNRRIQIFALKGLALRAIRGPLRVTHDSTGAIHVQPESDLTAAGVWEPWDVAVTRDGRLFVTDHANGLVHVFDRHGRWRAAYEGRNAAGDPLLHPTHIAVDRQCRIYVIQENHNSVTVLDEDGKFVEEITKADQAEERFCPTGLAVDANGSICITADSGLMFVADQDGAGHGCARPCRTTFHAPVAVAFDHDGNPIVADADRQAICSVDANAAYETSGGFLSEALDSEIYNCTWHRVLLRGALVAGTAVRIDTFTSESLKSIAEIRALPESRWATRQVDTTVGAREWDCLVFSPAGRYLWLRLTLTGNGTSTPCIDHVRVFFPRASSLRYLPAVYSEDPVSRDFLGRFLSIFDSVRGTISRPVDDFEKYLDPASAPAESPSPAIPDFLTWLASWIGLAIDRHWPVAKRRALLKNAHQLYKLRGTPEGLRLHVQLYTGSEPQILEHFKLRRWIFLNHARLGDQSAVWGSSIVKRLQLDVFDRIGEFRLIDSGDPLRDPFHVYAHRFTVVVPQRRCQDADLQRHALERIIEMAKPAHTIGDLQVTEGRLRIGLQSFIGIDTIIADYPDEVVEGMRRLNQDAVLGPSEDEAKPPAMRLGVRSRIGATTLLR